MSLYKNGRQGYKHVVERIFCVRVGRKFVICYLLFVKFTFFSFFFFFFFLIIVYSREASAQLQIKPIQVYLII